MEEKEDEKKIVDERFQLNDKLWQEVKREESKRGIIYLSYVPIGLSVSKIREIFCKYGDIDKIHLNKIDEEDMSIISKGKSDEKKQKKKRNNNKYQDGYIEFLNKKDAIKVESLLNNQPIGGKKRKNILREHFWHIKYIKNMTWNDLISSVVLRNISRKDKLQYSLKNMYKSYDQFLEKNMNNDNKKSKKRKYSSELKGNKTLSFLTIKKNKEGNEEKNNMNLETMNNIMHKERNVKNEIKDKRKTVSSDLLKCFM
ncbi:small subunit rRNA processing protein, putative [Plasmodium sp. gorilla clade G3]|nr:small subunit rRNA processing protein, putative [Plasmodium sp. gorilla clade G3]